MDIAGLTFLDAGDQPQPAKEQVGQVFVVPSKGPN
jgi:hypothetical protein